MTLRLIEAPTTEELEDHGPGCGHRARYRTLDGRHLCETCAQRLAGWAECYLCAGYGPTTSDPYGIGEEAPGRYCAPCIENDHL